MRVIGPGTTFAGYRVEKLVRRGGMGVVYRARQLELDRRVALKVIAPEAFEEPTARDRFLGEARTAASIEHPNVVPIYGAGEEDGVAYLVMRYIDGEDVRDLVRRDGPLPAQRAARIAADAAAGLDAIHRGGLVHRDVKPANVLLSEDGHVFLADFGLARSAATYSGTTQTGGWAGTLHYAPPEQIRGDRVDARADVYALGGVLHYMLTGHPPFERDDDEAVLWAHLTAPPPKPSRVRPGVPRAFDAVIARALAKAPADRFASAGALADAALAAAEGRRVPTAPRPSLKHGRAIVAGLAVAAVAVGIGLLLSGGNPATNVRHTTPTPTPASTPPRPHVGLVIHDRGARPALLALIHGRLWVAGALGNTIRRYDVADGRPAGSPIRVGRRVHGMVAAGGRVWVAVTRPRGIVEVDPRTGKVIGRLVTPADPVGLAAGKTDLFVVTRAQGPIAPNDLLRYDLRTGLPVQTVVVAAGINDVVVARGAVWIADRLTHWISRLPIGGDKPRGWQRLSASATDMTYGRHALWASVPLDNAMARIDLDHPREGLEGPVTDSPQQPVVAGGQVFVPSFTQGTLVKVSPHRVAPVGPPLRVGRNPVATTADRHHVWVAGLADDTITRVDLR
jgi:serine/threonine protein kinase